MTEQLRDHIRAHQESFQGKLLTRTYGPSMVRRVAIPIPNGGTRWLGIPTAQDQWIKQMLLHVMQPLGDPTFARSALPNLGAARIPEELCYLAELARVVGGG